MRNLNNVPTVILNSKSIGHAVDYKWSRKKIDKFLDPFGENESLESVLSKINHKGTLGLTAALLEWVYWRYTGYTQSVNDTQKRIEALWCAIHSKEEANPILFDTDLEIPAVGSVDGPLWIALMNATMVDVRYRKGSYFIQDELIGLVLLARHITPKKKVFDKWLDTIISELVHHYPCKYKSDTIEESDEAFYDSTSEHVICRQFFFDSEFKYSIEASENALQDFISNLDHKANPFLNLTKKAS